MKHFCIVLLLMTLSAAFVFCAKSGGGFFTGDFYGVTWGMKVPEVDAVFTGKKIGEDSTWDREIIYEHEENGAPVRVHFAFDRSDILLSIHVIPVGQESGANTKFFTEYTNRIVQKYGPWHESSVSVHTEARTNADAPEPRVETRSVRAYWSTARTTVIATAELSPEDAVRGARITLTPTWK